MSRDTNKRSEVNMHSVELRMCLEATETAPRSRLYINYFYNCTYLKFYFELSNQFHGPPLWSNGQTSRGPGSIPGATRRFSEVVGLERGPFSLVWLTEELFQGNSGSGLENQN
jgi:hypothetical protein